jgi:L-fuconolactonase
MPAAAPRIDSHHHFWLYSPEEYPWMNDSMQVIRRDFLPADLKAEIDSVGINGVVSVQARESVAETSWLLDFAGQHSFIQGVVGWVPLVDPQVAEILGPLAENPKLCAVRHVVQDEPDDNFILREDFSRGIRGLQQFGLAYDILIYERHLAPTVEFVDRHPNQVFVLDHVAKPRIKDRALSPWAENIRELAKRSNVYCKLSGMPTEADFQTWTDADLDPYFDVVLEAFEPQRLMFGSDWPVCLVATSYKRWFELVSRWIARFSADERDRILGGTAVEAYSLKL